jgi:hypothetical protein
MPATPTPAQSAASRRNGALSRGPATPEGKARAARNSVRHGLSGRTFFLLADEDPDDYHNLATDYLAMLAPRDLFEHDAADALVQVLWREQRASRLEAEALDERFAAALLDDPAAAAAAQDRAMQHFDRFLRYRSQLTRERAKVERDLDILRRRTLAPPRPRPLPDEPAEAAAADMLAADAAADDAMHSEAMHSEAMHSEAMAAVATALAAVLAARKAEAEMAAALGLQDEPELAVAPVVQHEPERAAMALAVQDEPERATVTTPTVQDEPKRAVATPAPQHEPEPAKPSRPLNRKQRRALAFQAHRHAG